MRKTLEDLAAEKYTDDDVAAAVIDHARKLGNEDKILSGELVLPHPQDAKIWHDRITGKIPVPGTDMPAIEAYKQLQARIEQLEREKREAD